MTGATLPTWRQYQELTKPRVVALLVFTALVGMFLAVPGLPPLHESVFGLVGIWLAASSAAAINHLIDQRIDKVMVRTAHRPLATGALRPVQVLVFALLLGIASMLVLALLVVAAVAQEWKTLTTYFAIVGLACLLFNLASMGVGYGAPLALKLPRKQAIAIAMEIGIHNGTLAIYIALNVMDNATMSIPAAVYSLLMFFTAAVFGWWISRNQARESASQP